MNKLPIWNTSIAGLRALTLWPEWIPAFTHLDKRTENRPWALPSTVELGEPIVLHAGARAGGPGPLDEQFNNVERFRVCAMLAGWHCPMAFAGVPDEIPGEIIYGPNKQAGEYPVYRYGPDGLGPRNVLSPGWERVEIPLRKAVAVAIVTGCDQDKKTPWDMDGKWHWRFGEIFLLPEPVPMAGHQGLWRIRGF